MNPSEPDTITITEEHFEDIRSAGADVRLSASESGFGAASSGRIAAVRGLLGEHGFPEQDISLQGIDHTPWAWIVIPVGMLASFIVLGAFGARSTAGVVFGFALLYAIVAAAKLGTVSATLQVRCGNAERVSRLIDVALSAGVDVQATVWRYDIAPPDRSAWTRQAIARARARADEIAAALGVRILGVHAFHEEHVTPRPSYPALAVPPVRKAESKARLSKTVGESLGDASGVDRAGVTVTVRYRVSAGEAAMAPSA
ncbi:Hypothetical protein A7982_08755 [Minicystis rosea]|nr:Hypothetical protein A7982_08755 [Minicystis rosea]